MSWKEAVLKKIVPGEELKEKVISVGNELVKKLRGEGLKAMFVGSCARGTFLPEDIDIDIFLMFPENTSEKEMKETIIKMAQKFLKEWEMHKASHPYIRGKYRGFIVEIVPCYDVKGRIKSAVDRTPWHHEFLKERIKGLEQDVLLLKKFLKNHHIYGAENQGFSGYLCELLIWYFGGFEKLLEAAKHWKAGERIEIVPSNKIFEEPLVVIDPVDPGRNVAACVSMENFAKFVILSNLFLKKPSEKWFFGGFKSKNIGECWKIKFERARVPDEILRTQLRRAERRVKDWLERHGFRVLRVESDPENVELMVEIGGREMFEKRRGPPFYEKEHVEQFILKHKMCWVEGERIYTIVKRPFKNAGECLQAFNQYPSHLKPIEIKRSACIFERIIGWFE